MTTSAELTSAKQRPRATKRIEGRPKIRMKRSVWPVRIESLLENALRVRIPIGNVAKNGSARIEHVARSAIGSIGSGAKHATAETTGTIVEV